MTYYKKKKNAYQKSDKEMIKNGHFNKARYTWQSQQKLGYIL